MIHITTERAKDTVYIYCRGKGEDAILSIKYIDSSPGYFAEPGKIGLNLEEARLFIDTFKSQLTKLEHLSTLKDEED